MTASIIAQIGIACLGVTAVWLSQSKSGSRWLRWACVLGLAAQPFWFYATWIADQWGMFGLCFAYTAAYVRGFWNHWVQPPGHAPRFTLWLAKTFGKHHPRVGYEFCGVIYLTEPGRPYADWKQYL